MGSRNALLSKPYPIQMPNRQINGACLTLNAALSAPVRPDPPTVSV